MEKIRLISTILKSTNSGMNAKLTKEFLLNFGFETIATDFFKYDKNNIVVHVRFDKLHNIDMFTDKKFIFKDWPLKRDVFHPSTLKEFYEIFNTYKTHVQHNS